MKRITKENVSSLIWDAMLSATKSTRARIHLQTLGSVCHLMADKSCGDRFNCACAAFSRGEEERRKRLQTIGALVPSPLVLQMAAHKPRDPDRWILSVIQDLSSHTRNGDATQRRKREPAKRDRLRLSIRAAETDAS